MEILTQKLYKYNLDNQTQYNLLHDYEKDNFFKKNLITDYEIIDIEKFKPKKIKIELFNNIDIYINALFQYDFYINNMKKINFIYDIRDNEKINNFLYKLSNNDLKIVYLYPQSDFRKIENITYRNTYKNLSIYETYIKSINEIKIKYKILDFDIIIFECDTIEALKNKVKYILDNYTYKDNIYILDLETRTMKPLKDINEL